MIRRRYLRRRAVALALLGLFVAAIWLVVRDCSTGAAGPTRTAAPAFVGYARLDFHQRAGQRVIAGFSGHSVPPRVRRAIRKGLIGGVILFSQNLGSRSEIRSLTRDLQRIRRPAGLRDAPLLVMVDQEGGLVKRLAGAPRMSAAQMGARGPDFARDQGLATGRNLVNAGFNLDLAPVLDVARPGGVIAGTDRAFGRTPGRVGRVGVAFADGLRAGGVAATAKHFPGLGAARENTDFAVQRIDLSKRKLRHIDLRPFRRFVASGGELVMVGTAIYPAFGETPAAFNRRIVVGELRRRLRFPGVTITDALESTAARAWGGPGKAAVGAARAGMDLMLYGDWRDALRGERAMARKLRAGRLEPIEFRGAVARVVNLRASLSRAR